MATSLLRCALGVAVASLPAFCDGPTLVGMGYLKPETIRVAPGQVTTFFVSGIAIDPSQPWEARELPLPTQLAGISLTIQRSVLRQSFAVRLIAVRQRNTCSADSSSPPVECLITMITGQIPYELAPPPDGADPKAQVVITTKGTVSKEFALQLVTDNLHVLTTCDQDPVNRGNDERSEQRVCSSIVTHADGSRVTADSPAEPGEEVVVYAYGLGETMPAVRSGVATPEPAPVLAYGSISPYRLITLLDFQPNAGPSPQPYHANVQPPPAAEFNGLTPGEVGLYQINIKLPEVFPPVPSCNLIKSPQELDLAFSNLTINLHNLASMDAAAICVRVPE